MHFCKLNAQPMTSQRHVFLCARLPLSVAIFLPCLEHSERPIPVYLWRLHVAIPESICFITSGDILTSCCSVSCSSYLTVGSGQARLKVLEEELGASRNQVMRLEAKIIALELSLSKAKECEPSHHLAPNPA